MRLKAIRGFAIPFPQVRTLKPLTKDDGAVDEPTLTAIASACVQECLRQQVGLRELGHLVHAYADAMRVSASVGSVGEELEQTLQATHATVDGGGLGKGSYRRTPVAFADGGDAAPAVEIARLVQALCRAWAEGEITSTDEFCKELLAIHPWTDGNGRTAFIVYNLLGGTLHAPQPLPDYFGSEFAPS